MLPSRSNDELYSMDKQMFDNHRRNAEVGSRGFSAKFRRVLIIAVLVVAAGGIAAATLCVFSWSCRQLTYAPVSGAAIANAGHNVERVVVSYSPRLVADYYAAPGKKPLILFVHGSAKDGRRSALTRLLASRLRADGFPVLALDLPGFGESEDPDLPLSKDFRFEDAVVGAARYAVKSGIAQPGRIVYVGHSLGAGVILRAGRIKPRPLSIVAVGAPITQDRFERYGESWRLRFAKGRLRDMDLVPDEQSLDVMGQYLVEMDPATQLSKGGLPPVLIVYGELEADYGVPIVRDHLAAIDTHNGLHVVPRAPHSYYITNGPWGLVFYNRDMFDSLAKATEDWVLRGSSATSLMSEEEPPNAINHALRQDRPTPTRTQGPSWISAYKGSDLGHMGTFAKWSKVEIELVGPASVGKSTNDNPFRISVNMTFVGPGGNTYVVPAFYDGDGYGHMDGNIWRVRFSPDTVGAWSFTSTSSNLMLEGYRGTFTVELPPADASNFGKRGRLKYVGQHYLKFADGPYWIKGGTNEPEDFLGAGVMGSVAGKQAAVDYLAQTGVNSMYILLHNVDGDGDNVWPWVERKESEHFDVAKLSQWEDLFEYIQSKGIVLHLVLEDDSGWTGFNRSMYYREMVARFAHHNGLIWNISEEYGENYSASDVKKFAQQIRNLDPYDHSITVHNVGPLAAWEPFLGDQAFDITSFQSSEAPQNAQTIAWRNKTFAAGRPLAISFDEAGFFDKNERRKARHVIWSVYMGGGNFELFASKVRQTGFEAFEEFWDDMRHARLFLEGLPFWEMSPANDLLIGGAGNQYCLGKPGEVYAIYLEQGGATALDLSGQAGMFRVHWYSPDTGQYSDGGIISGNAIRSLGPPPFPGDAAVLVRSIVGQQ